MTDPTITALRAEHARLAAALAQPMTPVERVARRQEIVALFRQVEQQVAEFTAFKETIRQLVEQFKASEPAPRPPASVRHDHLGASTHIERGWTALAGGEWQRAEACLREAMACDATSHIAQALLGWAVMHQGRREEALELCLHVLLREPQHGMARTAVGAICVQQGILGEALEHLTQVLQPGGDPRAALYANYWVGLAHLERSAPVEAVASLRKAVTLGPNLAEGWGALGLALWWSGERTEAIEAWQTAAGIRHSPYASRAVQWLELVNRGGEPPRSAPF